LCVFRNKSAWRPGTCRANQNKVSRPKRLFPGPAAPPTPTCFTPGKSVPSCHTVCTGVGTYSHARRFPVASCWAVANATCRVRQASDPPHHHTPSASTNGAAHQQQVARATMTLSVRSVAGGPPILSTASPPAHSSTTRIGARGARPAMPVGTTRLL